MTPMRILGMVANLILPLDVGVSRCINSWWMLRWLQSVWTGTLSLRLRVATYWQSDSDKNKRERLRIVGTLSSCSVPCARYFWNLLAAPGDPICAFVARSD
jgi:hypothetical protein